jgi:hypothetical protein
MQRNSQSNSSCLTYFKLLKFKKKMHIYVFSVFSSGDLIKEDDLNIFISVYLYSLVLSPGMSLLRSILNIFLSLLFLNRNPASELASTFKLGESLGVQFCASQL